MGGDAPDPGAGVPIGVSETDDQAVGDGEDLSSLHTVGPEQVLDGFLHPVDLRAGGHEAEAQLRGQVQKLVVIDAQGVPHHPFYGNSDGAADGKICVRPPPNTKLTSFRRRGQEKSCSPGRKNNNRDRKNRRGRDSAGLTAGFHSGALPAQLIVKLIEGPGGVARGDDGLIDRPGAPPP